MQPPTPPFFPEPGSRSVVLASHEFAPFRGGVATYVREIMLAAERGGHPVEVWTVDYRTGSPAEKPPEHEAGSSCGTKVVRLSSSGRLTPGGLLSLAWGFRQRRGSWRDRPVVLLSVGAQMAFFLLAAGGCAAREVTCVFHGSEVLRFQRNPLWRWLARRFYRRDGVRFAATTRYVESLLRGSGLLPPGSGVVLAPCALPDVFHVEQRGSSSSMDQSNQEEPRSKLRREGAAAEFRVLTVARLHPRKGQLEVARALASLPVQRRARVVYQMVGVGEAAYRAAVEAECRSGGVRCEFLGALDDPALIELYTGATVYAQASRTLAQSVEGFGITFLEAAACGCPAAAWRAGGVAEAVLDGETGLLVEEGDVAGLTAALERLFNEPETRASLGERGRTFARGFRWEHSARTLCGTRLEG